MAKKDFSHIPIEIIECEGETNPHNPFDQLSPEARAKKIVQIWARIYLRMTREKNDKEVEEKTHK